MRADQRGEAPTPVNAAIAPPRRVADWRSRVKSARRVSVRPRALTSGALMVLAALAVLAVAGYGVVKVDVLWAVCAALAAVGMLALTLRGFPLLAALPLLGAGVLWGLAMRAWLPDKWTHILASLKFIGGNLAFVAPLVGAYLAAIALDSRRLSRVAIDEAVSGRRWWGEPSDAVPQLAELEAIPAVRFFALTGVGCSHVVAAGRRVALTMPTVWPNGSYSMSPDGQLLRDGRPFAHGADDLDRLAASVRSWQGRLKGVEVSVRGFLVVSPARDDIGGAVTVEVAPGEHLEVVHAHEFTDLAGGWLAVEPYRVDLAVMERLLKLMAPVPADGERRPGASGRRGARRKRAAPPAPGPGRSDELTANQTGPGAAGDDPDLPIDPPYSDEVPGLPPLDDRPSYDGTSSFGGSSRDASFDGFSSRGSSFDRPAFDGPSFAADPPAIPEARFGSAFEPAATFDSASDAPPEPRFGSAFEPAPRFDRAPDASPEPHFGSAFEPAPTSDSASDGSPERRFGSAFEPAVKYDSAPDAASDAPSAYGRRSAPEPPPEEEIPSLLTADDPLAVLDRLAQLNLRSSPEPDRTESLFPPKRDWDAESARQIAAWTAGEDGPPTSSAPAVDRPRESPPTAPAGPPPGISRLQRAMRDLNEEPVDIDEFVAGAPPEPAPEPELQPEAEPESKRSWRKGGGSSRKEKRSRRKSEPDATEVWLSGLASDEPPSWSSARGPRRSAPNFDDDDDAPPPDAIPAQRTPFDHAPAASPPPRPGRHASSEAPQDPSRDSWSDARPEPTDDKWAGLRSEPPTPLPPASLRSAPPADTSEDKWSDLRSTPPADASEDRWSGLRSAPPPDASDDKWSGLRSAPSPDASDDKWSGLRSAPSTDASEDRWADLRSPAADAAADKWAGLRSGAPDNSRVVAPGSSRVGAPGSSRVGAPDGSRVNAPDSSRASAPDGSRAGAPGNSSAGPTGDRSRPGAAPDDFASWWESAGQGQGDAAHADAGRGDAGRANPNGSTKPDWAVDPTDPRDTLPGSQR